MTKRILLIFFVLAAMILPASAAGKGKHRLIKKHSITRSKGKSIRKTGARRGKSVKSAKRAARNKYPKRQ